MKGFRVVRICLMAALALVLNMAAFCVAYADSGESVTVYLTVSDDGDFVIGNDGTTLANAPIEVEWFDLAEYGLERFDYEGAAGRPTLLHLFIRATEQFYLCREMTADDFAYGDTAMWVTGNPASLYLKYFWDHDENLLYHVNDKYPEESPGWGATCDRIVLEGGDTVDLAMFTSWGISTTGTFAYFKNRQFDAAVGEDVVLEGASVGGITQSAAVFSTALQNAAVRVSADGGFTWADSVAVTDREGRATLRFDEPGAYLVSAGPAFPEYESALGVDYRCVAPPIAVVRVMGEALPPLVVSFDTGGGSSVPSQSMARYATCAKPDDPVMSGYTFKGWFEDQDFQQEYDFGRAVVSDLVLYAKWEKDAEPAPVVVDYTPGRASIKNLKPGKGKLTVKWKKVGEASGYKVQVRLLKQKGVKKAGKWKTYSVGVKAQAKTVKKLRAGKLYQVRVRAYRIAAGKTYLGKWSKVRKARVK